MSLEPQPPSVIGHTDYVEYLRAVLAAKSRRNKAYSLRAFANSIGVTPATLSSVLKGTRGISIERAREIAGKLGLGGEEAQYFLLLVEHARARTPEIRTEVRSKLESFRPRPKPRVLSPADFERVADWRAMAILEICDLRPIRADEVADLAESLRASSDELLGYLDELIDFGLVEFRNDCFVRVAGELRVDSERVHASLQAYHRKFWKLALGRLDEPVTERYFASDMLPISAEDVPILRRKLGEFLDEIHAWKGPAEKRRLIYGLGLGFFKIFDAGEAPKVPAPR